MTKDGELATVDEKFDRKKFDDNEDKNFHTENGVALVNMFGDAYEKRQIAQIKKDHDKRGSITSKDQKVRDALVKKYLPKLKEEVELDESVIEQLKSLAKGGSRYKPKSGAVEIKDDKGKVINKLTPEGAKKVLDKMKDPISGKSSVPDRTRGGAEKKIIDIVKNFKEEVDLDEGKMKELHGYIQDGKTAEQIAKLMKLDVKTIKALMNSHYPEEAELDEKVEYVEYKFKNKNDAMAAKKMLDAVQMMSFEINDDNISGGELMVDSGSKDMTKYHKEVMKKFRPKVMTQEKADLDEASARGDARKAMMRDKDLRRGKDSADKDDSATDDDIKGASKNIIMQMRKAQSLKGRFDVEFADGKKVKIPAKMAMAVQQKYNSMRKPSDKAKFQAKVAKSYRDMLSALKEELQPNKESVLDRIDRKIKEKNDG